MALVQNKPSHFNGREKICIQTKFELSKWTIAPSMSNFPFRSLNKLGPLVAYKKTAHMVCGHMGQGQSTQVWLSSDNFKDNKLPALCELRITHMHTLYARQR